MFRSIHHRSREYAADGNQFGLTERVMRCVRRVQAWRAKPERCCRCQRAAVRLVGEQPYCNRCETVGDREARLRRRQAAINAQLKAERPRVAR